MLWLWGLNPPFETFETTNDATNAFKNIKQLIETCLKADGAIPNKTGRSKQNFGPLFMRGSCSLCVGRSSSAWVAHLLHGSLGAQVGRSPQVGRSCHIVHFAESVWRPSRCPNRACDSSLESYWSLLSNKSRIMQFWFDLLCQKSNLPTLVKMSRMRLPQGRALLQSTF